MAKFPYAIEKGKLTPPEGYWPPLADTLFTVKHFKTSYCSTPEDARFAIRWCARYVSVFWVDGGTESGATLDLHKIPKHIVDWEVEFQRTLQRVEGLAAKMQTYYEGLYYEAA